jgi:hypothetical protein
LIVAIFDLIAGLRLLLVGKRGDVMPSLPTLLSKFQSLTRQHVAIEAEIDDVRQQIIDARNAPKPRAKRVTSADQVEVVKATIKVLREARETLPRKEIAARLGITPHAASYRLERAIEMKLVEKVSLGRYRCTSVVPLV